MPDIPFPLSEAIKNQRTVLLFGAGASKECCDKDGKRPPNGEQLRDVLAKTFLGVSDDKRDLMTVSEMAISSGAGEAAVFDEIERSWRGFKTSEAHKKLSMFRWRALATTNYDSFIEDGYNASKGALQTCLPFVKDAEPFDDRLRAELNPVPLLKLHGCLHHRLDADIPLVLSHEHYANYAKNRTQLFQRLGQWASESPLVFIGYSLQDSHIRKLLYDLNSDKRPRWFIVTPDADTHDIDFYAKKNIGVIKAAFGEFIDSVEQEVPDLFRTLAQPASSSSEPYRKFYRTKSIESLELRSSLQKDFTFLHSSLSSDIVNAQDFYSGHDSGWGGILKNFDFQRGVAESLLFRSVVENDAPSEPVFVLLQGNAGAGKTIALKRAAYEAATSLEVFTLWLNENGVPRFRSIQEIHDLTGLPIYLFVDEVSLHAGELLALLDESKRQKMPLVVVGAEREADWGAYCGALEEVFHPEILTLRRLSEKEINDLLDLLEKHNCLGMLASKSREEQVAAFADESKSDRQLLVALHELTQGKPFEQIVIDEFNRIVPKNAQTLYLDIATMHQFGIHIRAGTISRISGISFLDYEREFFEPLKGIVQTSFDNSTGDYFYQTRHAKVAEILFGQVCNDDTLKSTQYRRVIEGIDVGYSSDMRALSGICKGRKISRTFARIEEARSVFDIAHQVAPNAAFLYQQRAILEYTNQKGSLSEAEHFALKAREVDNNNHIYIHTLAEIARHQANADDNRVRKEQHRSKARNLLGEIMIKDSRVDGSHCNLLVDEVIDASKDIDPDAKDHELISFDDLLERTISRLSRALQKHPENAELSLTEARLWSRLKENDKASTALQRAIKAKPKGSGAYVRLANLQAKDDDLATGKETLTKELKQFPEDKGLHRQMARLLVQEIGIPNEAIEEHFQKSFSVGDNNFDSRVEYAGYLFWAGRAMESQSLFEDIDKRAPPEYRQKAPNYDDRLTSRLPSYRGVVTSKKERFFFVRSAVYPKEIFAYFTSLAEVPYEDLNPGQHVAVRVRFNRSGPVATLVECI